jgi:hypothetical protein
MKSRKRLVNLVLRAVVVSFVAAAWLHGAGLEYLTSNATAIVVGSVDSRVESQTAVSFTINISRVLKGSVPGPTANVVHSWAGLLRGVPRAINQPLFGIWFLVKQPSGTWDVLTARPAWVRTVLGLFLPGGAVVPGGQYAYGPGTSIADAVVHETASAIRTTNEDPAILLGAIEAMDTPAVRAVLETYLSSNDIGFQATALAGNLERGIPGSIRDLVRVWPSISNDPHGDAVIAALGSSWRDAAPASVATLASFAAASSAGSDVRAAAIRALAAIHTKETLATLASLLPRGNASEQERAVYGLSAFANGCPMQTKENVVSMEYLQCNQPSAYRTPETLAHFGFRPGPSDQETALVVFWQAWWNGHPELH